MVSEGSRRLREGRIGTDHPDTGRMYNKDIGAVYANQGKYDEALDLVFRKALDL